ncbi:DUF429 domain-containing protein [Salinicola halophilus]|uniref:DUF429 domain-containing protein n=1 Tax=Salinicola halophilus TaxID=184065 RepID=UPI000DA26368|nr:DUF429 domain-containing protein [Salinicola halophilus]
MTNRHEPLPFQRLLHADWSVSPGKRWAVQARRDGGRWVVSPAWQLDDSAAWLATLFDPGEATLAGFDFCLGVPEAWANRAGVEHFTTWLDRLGQGAWPEFFDVAETAAEISLRRPFYPRVSRKGVTRDALVAALGVADFDALRREGERRVPGRLPSPLFWTLGANQVGKATLAGWRDVILPARRRGARLWPFDGELAALARSGMPVLCETWPTLAADRLGVALRHAQSKRRQADRQSRAQRLLTCHAERGIDVHFTPAARAQIGRGFGTTAAGEDAFDAMLGLLAMIDQVEAFAVPNLGVAQREREGWTLGL